MSNIFNELRIDILRDTGVKITDEAYFDRAVVAYGYKNLTGYLWDHFVDDSNDDLQVKYTLNFEDLVEFYLLDRNLQMQLEFMLRTFEDGFRQDLAEGTLFALGNKFKLAARNNEEVDASEWAFFEKEYRTKDGRLITREAMVEELEKVKANHLDPFGEQNEASIWMITKEISFASVCDFFLLLPEETRQKLLDQLFKKKIDTETFIDWVKPISYFYRRYNSSYSILGSKWNNKYLYSLLLKQLSDLRSRELILSKEKDIKNILDKYIQKQPLERKFLHANFATLYQ